MKNQKYYCAWHEEKGILGSEYQSPKITTTREDAEDLFFQEFGHLLLSSKLVLDAKIQAIEYAKFQGWQVKEVVIVDNDFKVGDVVYFKTFFVDACEGLQDVTVVCVGKILMIVGGMCEIQSGNYVTKKMKSSIYRTAEEAFNAED